MSIFFFQAEDGIRDLERSRGLGDVYKGQVGILLIIVAVTLIILSKYIQKNLHEAKRLFKARHILRTK